MTTAAERLRESAQRASTATASKAVASSGGQAPPSSDTDTSTPAPSAGAKTTRTSSKAAARQVRQVDVKKTLALSPAMNGELADWQNATARELGLARVTAQEVLESLVAELLAEPQLAAQVKNRLASNRA